MRGFLQMMMAMTLVAWVVHAEPVMIAIDARAPGKEISPEFIGLSYEMSELLPDQEGRRFFTPDNAPLLRLFRTLGVKSLRVGGNTADRPSITMPSRADIDSLFAFAAAAGVKTLYTLRFNQGTPKPVAAGHTGAGSKETLAPYDPEADAATADYILEHYRSNLECFIIGNEPDHYYADFASYKEAWLRFANAITAPGVKFCGPSATAGRVAWSADFARELGHDPRIAFISQHEYAAGSGRIKDVAAAREKLLSPRIEAGYEKFYRAFVPAVEQAGLGYRLEECNSFSNGGAPGVSDQFPAALWAVDYMHWWAEHGAAGLNFHTSGFPLGSQARGGMRYAAFANAGDGYAARPLGYGMKMFDLGGHGSVARATVNPPNEGLSAYGVVGNDGAIYLTLVNRGEQKIEIAGIAPAFERGDWVSLENKDGRITLGGAPIGEDGMWNGAWKAFSPKDKLVVPAESVAVMKLMN